jgi:predicted dinucleotide-binding enzyme
MAPSIDFLIIGAGHHGPARACDIAAAGPKVHVVQRRGVRDAAVTKGSSACFCNSTASHAVAKSSARSAQQAPPQDAEQLDRRADVPFWGSRPAALALRVIEPCIR